LDDRREEVTPEVVRRSGTRAEYQDADVGPGERAEVVVDPSTPLRDPVLFLATDPGHAGPKIEVEAIYHGQVAVVCGRDTADQYRNGIKLHLTVTRTEPIRVVVSSDCQVPTRVGVSLVVDGEDEENNEIGD
jgi:hypothetical protein